MVNETKRNLQTMISQHKIAHGMGIVDAPTHISEILSGITLRISSRRPLDIASGSGSISNFFSRYLFTSCILGLMGTETGLVKRLVISASAWGLPVTNIRVLGDLLRTSLIDSRSRQMLRKALV